MPNQNFPRKAAFFNPMDLASNYQPDQGDAALQMDGGLSGGLITFAKAFSRSAAVTRAQKVDQELAQRQNQVDLAANKLQAMMPNLTPEGRQKAQTAFANFAQHVFSTDSKHVDKSNPFLKVAGQALKGFTGGDQPELKKYEPNQIFADLASIEQDTNFNLPEAQKQVSSEFGAILADLQNKLGSFVDSAALNQDPRYQQLFGRARSLGVDLNQLHQQLGKINPKDVAIRNLYADIEKNPFRNEPPKLEDAQASNLPKWQSPEQVDPRAIQLGQMSGKTRTLDLYAQVADDDIPEVIRVQEVQLPMGGVVNVVQTPQGMAVVDTSKYAAAKPVIKVIAVNPETGQPDASGIPMSVSFSASGEPLKVLGVDPRAQKLVRNIAGPNGAPVTGVMIGNQFIPVAAQAVKKQLVSTPTTTIGPDGNPINTVSRAAFTPQFVSPPPIPGAAPKAAGTGAPSSPSIPAPVAQPAGVAPPNTSTPPPPTPPRAMQPAAQPEPQAATPVAPVKKLPLGGKYVPGAVVKAANGEQVTIPDFGQTAPAADATAVPPAAPTPGAPTAQPAQVQPKGYAPGTVIPGRLPSVSLPVDIQKQAGEHRSYLDQFNRARKKLEEYGIIQFDSEGRAVPTESGNLSDMIQRKIAAGAYGKGISLDQATSDLTSALALLRLQGSLANLKGMRNIQWVEKIEQHLPSMTDDATKIASNINTIFDSLKDGRTRVNEAIFRAYGTKNFQTVPPQVLVPPLSLYVGAGAKQPSPTSSVPPKPPAGSVAAPGSAGGTVGKSGIIYKKSGGN